MNTPTAPLVSIILPIYNAEKFVEKTIKALFNQSLSHIEIIAINDCSTDSSLAILTKLSQADNRLKVIKHEYNQGVHQARATGLSHCTASYIGFVDADDIPKHDMFQKLYNRACETNADIVICGVDWVTEAGKKSGTRITFPKDKIICEDTFHKFCNFEFGTGAFWNKLYRRELILKYGMQKLRWHQRVSEDTIVNIGCFYEAKTVCLLKEPLYGYVRNDNSATQSTDDSKMFVDMYRAFALALDQYRKLDDIDLCKIAKLYQIQFSVDAYWLTTNDSLIQFNEQIKEATQLINDVFPAGLAMLLNRKEKNEQLSPMISNKYISQSLRALVFELRKRFNF